MIILKRHFIIACVLSFSLTANALEDIPDIKYEKFTLPNGLRVLVHEDHKIPVVAINVWYHVGSKDEEPGKTGFAHLFEHLMFNGTENYNDEYFGPFQQVGATDMNDFIKWDQNFYDNKLGAATPSLIKTMEQTFLKTKVKKRNQKLSREQEGQHTYAFAQNLAYYNGYKRWSHSGSWVAYNSHYTRFPEISFSVVVFCNTREIDATDVSDEIIDLYFENKKDL